MSREKLADSIGEISDKYIEEALGQSVLPKRRILKIAAAVILCILAAGGGYGIKYHGNFSWGILHPSEDSGKGASSLTVVAYAQEADGGRQEDEGRELEEEVAVEFSEYAPWMSSVPDMPFSFSYDAPGQEVDIVVASDSPGTMKTYHITGDGVWEVERQGASLHIQSGEKVYWSSGGREGGITVEVFADGEQVETKYIAIRENDAGKYTAVLKSKKGVESQKDILEESMEYAQYISAYAPDLLVCNQDYLAFANLRGMVVYDCRNNQVASVIDLQEIDCNNFYSHNRHTRVIPTDSGMLLLNESAGEIEDIYYSVSFQEGLGSPELTRCKCEEQEGEELLKRYQKYQKGFMKETSFRYVHSQTARESFYSKYSICWKNDSGDRMKSCLLVEYSDLVQQKIYYSVLSKNMKSGESEKEKLNISVSVAEESQRPAAPNRFVYTGRDEVKRAICNYIAEMAETGFRETDFHEAYNVLIPVVQREYGRFQEGKRLVCFAVVCAEDWRMNGNLLQAQAGAQFYAKFVLYREGDGYRMKKMKVARGDGAMLEPSVLRLMKGYPAARQRFRQGSWDDGETEKEQKKMIRMYVRQNGLDIKYYKEYGWNKVKL